MEQVLGVIEAGASAPAGQVRVIGGSLRPASGELRAGGVQEPVHAPAVHECADAERTRRAGLFLELCQLFAERDPVGVQ
jgi:hypothetical protein